MKLKAERTAEWPTGLHWTPGEIRDVQVAEGTEIPAWLVVVKATKAKKAAPKPDEG
jgi:hypothetical protein